MCNIKTDCGSAEHLWDALDGESDVLMLREVNLWARI